MKRGVETTLPPVAQRELEHGSRSRRVVELKDAEDRVFGQVVYEIDPHYVPVEDVLLEPLEEDSSDVKGGYPLLSLKLKIPQGQEIDVLALANLHKVDILVGNNDTSTYYPRDGKHGIEVIVAPLPVDQVNLAILLHELGHAEQGRDAKMSLAYELCKKIPGEWYQYERFLKDLRKLDFLSEALVDLEPKINRLVALLKEHSEIDKQINPQGYGQPRDRNNAELNERYQELRVNIIVLMKEIDAIGLLKFIRATYEADATSRALAWLKQIEEMGINILAAQKAGVETHAWDGKREIDDPQARLSRALESYCRS